jgi:hypothetical protein
MSFRKEMLIDSRERAFEDSSGNQALADGYEAMANDEEREAEALEWSEAIIGEVIP